MAQLVKPFPSTTDAGNGHAPSIGIAEQAGAAHPAGRRVGAEPRRLQGPGYGDAASAGTLAESGGARPPVASEVLAPYLAGWAGVGHAGAGVGAMVVRRAARRGPTLPVLVARPVRGAFATHAGDRSLGPIETRWARAAYAGAPLADGLVALLTGPAAPVTPEVLARRAQLRNAAPISETGLGGPTGPRLTRLRTARSRPQRAHGTQAGQEPDDAPQHEMNAFHHHAPDLGTPPSAHLPFYQRGGEGRNFGPRGDGLTRRSEGADSPDPTPSGCRRAAQDPAPAWCEARECGACRAPPTPWRTGGSRRRDAPGPCAG